MGFNSEFKRLKNSYFTRQKLAEIWNSLSKQTVFMGKCTISSQTSMIPFYDRNTEMYSCSGYVLSTPYHL